MKALLGLLLTLTLLSCAIATGAPANESAPVHRQEASLEESFDRVQNSVVTIGTMASTGILDAGGNAVTQQGVGSGVLVSADGLILTASHVVHSADEVVVEFADGSTRKARVRGSVKAADVAMIQVLGKLPDSAVVATLGDSDISRIGNRVFVIGAPLGISHTLSVGYLSARRKTEQPMHPFDLELFQTDAAINKGNSGGPMFNMSGEVIGIVSHIATLSGGSDGIGFAVTSNLCRELLLERPLFWSGIEELVVSGALAEALNVPNGRMGLLVLTVAKNSPAERLGLRGGTIPIEILGQPLLIGGDIILECFGIRIQSDDDLARIMEEAGNLTADKMIRLRVLRAGAIVDLGRKVADLTAIR